MSAAETVSQPDGVERPPILRVGDDRSFDTVVEGARYLYCRMGPADAQLGELAGWGKYVTSVHNETYALRVPDSARSAASILGGMEAWMGEKDEVIDRIVTYANLVYTRYGVIDNSVSLDTVVTVRPAEVGEETDAFILPPHTTTDDQLAATQWREGMVRDAEAILGTDPRQTELLEKLRSGLAFVGGPQS